MLNAIGMDNVCLHGFMRQKERVAALTQFRSNLKCTLIATNVAARGLDIPSVDLVVNHKLPLEPKEYIHRYDNEEAVKVFTTVSVTRREQEAQLDNEEFEQRKKNYRVKRWIMAGVDPDEMEQGLEEMRRKRIKAAKKAKLAKIKEIQAQTKKEEERENERLQNNETEDIDVSIKQGLKKVNKTLMKKDERFKNVIGKISKIKRKAERVRQKDGDSKKKKGVK
ncbi:unnamed protein product [Leptidea sinapis]|uniref:ATP-dependent RNA helicase n=1 Tax=Leptidea sinapis TaxID=189913 RepID=A0A5E4QIM2_9NEOP|nr:unnamed protein product [Leptidea sinapis]